jgi:hypothetical protein
VTTNEGCVVPVAMGLIRSETTQNYTWLAEAFYNRFKQLPRAVIMDGDRKMREAFQTIATQNGLTLSILLCMWHLFCDLEKNLVAKTPGVDTFELKKKFYELRNCVTADDFDVMWKTFFETFGTIASAQAYLTEYLYDQRMMWARPWTGLVFFGGVDTTGISESVHAMLASGKSAQRSLTDLVVLVDRIGPKQIEKSLKESIKHDETLGSLSISDLGGFVVPSVAPLLSGLGFSKLKELNASSSFFSVSACDPAHEFALRSWTVRDMRFKSGQTHNVSELSFPLLKCLQMPNLLL